MYITKKGEGYRIDQEHLDHMLASSGTVDGTLDGVLPYARGSLSSASSYRLIVDLTSPSLFLVVFSNTVKEMLG